MRSLTSGLPPESQACEEQGAHGLMLHSWRSLWQGAAARRAFPAAMAAAGETPEGARAANSPLREGRTALVSSSFQE